ncbi:MAG: substrate-binding domain-containing protein, partial [Limisphaerales bacterium]
MKRINILLLALVLAALFQGCGNNNKSANSVPQKELRLAFVANNPNDFWSIVHLGCDSAARQLGNVDLDFCVPPTNTVAAQEEIVSNLVANGIDGIAISPIDSAKETDFLAAIPSNVLLVCADSDAEHTRRACYIGSDNVAAGEQAAELVKAALPRGGKILLLVGYPNAQNARERIQGIKAALAGSNIEILGTLADQSSPARAQANAENAMNQYPGLAGMVGLYDYDGPAILAAVRKAGKTGKIKIVCFDDDSQTLDGVAAGDIFGT